MISKNILIHIFKNSSKHAIICLVISLLFGTGVVSTFAQSIITQNLTIENLLEQYLESSELQEFDITHLTENVIAMADQPLDINKVTADDLAEIFFLTAADISAIINHRDTYGDFMAMEELQTIGVLDIQKIRLLSYLLKVGAGQAEPYNLRDVLNASESALFLKYKRVLQQRAGYIERQDGTTPYVGNPDHYFLRYRIDAGRKLKAGFTMEKDPGEAFFSGVNKRGFDFYSGYLYAERVLPWIKAISLGDYAVSMGQGLILHNSFGGNKSVFTVDIKKDGNTIRQYSSVNETNFFRGGAITVAPLQNLEITAFGSSKLTNGSVSIDSTQIDDFGTLSSIARDGLHRTTSEINRKNSTTQTNYGGTIQYKFHQFLKVGINHLTYRFSNPLEPSPALYRVYQFRGDRLSNSSFDYQGRYKNVTYFGEYAMSSNGGVSQIHSAIVGLDRSMDIAISYRDFGETYQSIDGNAFGETTLPINEQGLYLGTELRPNNQWKIAAYIDIWKNPWLRFRVDKPGNGREAILRIDYVKKRKFNAYLQYRFETKNINSSLAESRVDPVISTYSHRARAHFSYIVSKQLELRSRIEGVRFDRDGNSQYGIMMYQDILFKPESSPFSGNIRMAYFDTDGFEARIYTYENDLLYEFLIPFFQQKGTRSYFNLRYRINNKYTWECKLAHTILSNASSIGSGNEEINGPARTEFKTQLRIRF